MSSSDSPLLPSPTRRNALWFSCQMILQVFFIFWLRYRARGTTNLPQEGGGLVIVNHQSFLDPLLVGLPLRRPISYLARDSLFRVPVVGTILRNTYVMPINREAAGPSSLKEAIGRARHGFLVGIFPEGTRTQDGAVGEFKPGFIALVRRMKVPVYPVAVAGAFEAYPRSSRFIRPGKVRVVFGEPIPVEELAELSKKGREDECIARIRREVVRCHEEASRWRNGEE